MSEKSQFQKHVLEAGEIGDFVSELIIKTAGESIAVRGRFTLGVSGGSIINILADKLALKPNVQWDKWKIFFCDERLVPFSDPESTFAQYKKRVVDQVGHEDSWVAINPELSVEDCAADYQQKVLEVFGETELPSFDMLLLGMGPDGHTCSLFPNHELLSDEKLIIAPISNSPKPPPQRVTMTLPVLNNARNAVFISAGASKAETIEKVFGEPSSELPASLVRPKTGVLTWVMDKAAASRL